MPIFHRRWPGGLPCLTLLALLLPVFLMNPQMSRGEVPRHQHGEPANMQHEATTETPQPKVEQSSHEDMQHDMAHDGHAMPQDDAQAEHVHPAPTEVPPEAVGLDEKLGQKLPNNLTFTDEQGHQIALDSLITKPTVIAPIYYRCPNVCHFLQGDLARVLPLLKLEPGEDFQVVSISFDETETPELARRSRDTYMAAMNNAFPASSWRFLTGSAEQIHAFTEAIGFHFQRSGADFVHPVAMVVVSPEGQIIRYLHGTHILPKDLTLALYEAKSGRIGTTIRKVVQYCFSFDPEQKTYVFNLLRISATFILLTLGAFLAFLILTGKKKGKVSKYD